VLKIQLLAHGDKKSENATDDECIWIFRQGDSPYNSLSPSYAFDPKFEKKV
jgi:hypothetical protein